MNIVVNTQLLLKDKLEGLGWFTYETLKRITKAHPEHTFYFVFDRPYDRSFIFGNHVKPIIMRPPSRHPILWYLRFQWLLPRLLKRLNADVFLSPDGWSTLHTKVPCVQVIHDINFEHFPHDLPLSIRKYFRYYFPRTARKASIVATVSQYSKNDIMNTYQIPEAKIKVLYNGCNDAFTTQEETTNQKTRQIFADGHPYFLYVGALLPRKNIVRLFQAFEIFKKEDTHNTKLLIVGKKKWWTNEMAAAYESMHYKTDVVFLGRRSVEELNKLYSAAVALTFVPYFEGFGIPILEAFNSGTAVISSNCTSIPEVTGDAALLVDPFNVQEIARAMKRISNDIELRTQMVKKAQKRTVLFSWDKTAEKLWNCIEMASNKPL